MDYQNGGEGMLRTSISSLMYSPRKPSMETKRKKIYTVYKRRYWMLFIYCLLSIFSAISRINHTQVRAVLNNVYDMTDLETKIVAWLFPIFFVPFAILGTIIYNNWSLRTGLIIAAGVQCLG